MQPRAWRRVALVALLLSLPMGCGEILLEGPEEELPDPFCEPGRILGEDGICRPPFCEWDDECPSGQRCDRIDGRCVPSTF